MLRWVPEENKDKLVPAALTKTFTCLSQCEVLSGSFTEVPASIQLIKRSGRNYQTLSTSREKGTVEVSEMHYFQRQSAPENPVLQLAWKPEK